MHVTDLLKIEVKDVMTSNVLTLSTDDTVETAVDLFLKKQISGAPVVDRAGKCAGVLSIHDIVEAEERVAREQLELVNRFYRHSDLILPVEVYDQELQQAESRIAPVLTHAVSEFMVADVVTIGRYDSLGKAIRYMVDAQIHRVIVTDSHGVVCGMLTTTDVMAGLLRACNAECQEASSVNG